MNFVITGVFAAVIGLVIGYVGTALKMKASKEAAELTLLNAEQEATNLRGQAEREADLILKEAKHESSSLKKEALLEAKEEARKYREEVDAEFKSERQELKQLESRLAERASNLDRKDDILTSKEQSLEHKEQSLTDRTKHIDTREQQLEELEHKKVEELERVAALSQGEARDIILNQTEEQLSKEIASRIRDAELEVKERSDKIAKDILVQAMQRMAGDFVAEQTNSTVHLPDDSMKGRIIGREGRNIRTFESLTGVDVIIDDTPEVVTLSGFDPIRREIARMTMESLLKDGRIHPARIEELVEKNRQEIDNRIREYGEAAAYEIGAPNLHPDLMKIMGRLQFRTSYGQNVLRHSIEVAKLSGIIASELGENATLARRAGFLHDIGKAIDREVEGSHVDLGIELCQKYHEPEVVINAVASHHGGTEPTSLISFIVAAADAISAARPGARRKSLETYTNRLKELEEIANSYKGVEKSFAVQAGREVRIMVVPDEVSDDDMTIMARNISQQIQDQMQYPGVIKVNIIRESRAVDYAK